mmetsp:Transcript_34312/g.71841  ORF Transcript_34312/g.71841 Transcript_34312/m.71841 type:complete len:241 (+) Transcript_34312:188-910(+)
MLYDSEQRLPVPWSQFLLSLSLPFLPLSFLPFLKKLRARLQLLLLVFCASAGSLRSLVVIIGWVGVQVALDFGKGSVVVHHLLRRAFFVDPDAGVPGHSCHVGFDALGKDRSFGVLSCSSRCACARIRSGSVRRLLIVFARTPRTSTSTSTSSRSTSENNKQPSNGTTPDASTSTPAATRKNTERTILAESIKTNMARMTRDTGIGIDEERTSQKVVHYDGTLSKIKRNLHANPANYYDE